MSSQILKTTVLSALTLLALSLVAQAQQPKATRASMANSQGRQKNLQPQAGTANMRMPLVAPLFIEDSEFTSTLVLVNGSGVHTYADVVLRALDGKEITWDRVKFAPHSQRRVEIGNLLKSAGSAATTGSLTVMQSAKLNGMSIGAQLSLTYSKFPEPNYIDEELAMPSALGSQTLRGVAEKAEGSPLIAISSLSESVQHINLECLASGGRNFSKSVELAPGETLLTEACSGQTVHGADFPTLSARAGEEPRLSAGIALRSDGMPGSFAAFALTPHREKGEQFFTAVSFADPKMIVSATTLFIGVPVGSATILPEGKYVPQLALANFSLKEAHVRIKYARTSGGIPNIRELANIIVPAKSSRALTLDNLNGDVELRNSFLITSDVLPGDLVAKLNSVSDSRLREVEMLGKDERDPENGGSHPWSLEQGAESTLLLFNHTLQSQFFDVLISGEGAAWEHRYKLAPLQTEAVSIGRLIQDAVKDDSGRILPRALTSGQVLWYTRDPEKGTGRLLQSNRHTAMARNFSCGLYYVLCGGQLTTYTTTFDQGSTVNFASLEGLVCNVNYETQCGGVFSSLSYGYNYIWSSQYANIASISGSNFSSSVDLFGAGAGTSLVTGTVFSNYCSFSQSANAYVTPTIIGPNTVWWFSGQHPNSTAYPTSITLTSSAGSSTTWSVTAGANKVSLSNTTGASVSVSSSGQYFSSSVGDIMITAAANGRTSNPFSLTTRKPYRLVAGTIVNQCDSTYGYSDFLNYTIQDQLLRNLPAGIPINEKWTTTVAKDYSGTNWRRDNAKGFTTPDAGFSDHIQGEAFSLPAVPTPSCAGTSTTKVEHWGQEWRVGTLTIGAGSRVQTDTLQKYIDHGLHLSIASPAP